MTGQLSVEEFPTLYKMDSKGKIREWSISAYHMPICINDEFICYYEQVHGLKDGKKQETTTDVNQGKNIGKANETTAWEQCVLEAKSLWNKQKDRKGYSETIPTEKPLLPMLAQSHDKHGHKISYPAFVQPKLDGIRCFIYVDGENVKLVSRTGKEFQSLGHIADAVRELVSVMGKSVGSFILDGELYNHDFKDDFQGLVSAIKRDKPSENTHLVQFHCYDYVAEGRDFEDRVVELQNMDQWLQNTYSVWCPIRLAMVYVSPIIQIVPTFKVKNLDEVVEQNSEWLKDGYEGSMIRNAKGGYQPNRRSPDLQKYKSFIDQEFEIVGAYQNKGKMEKQCTFLCKTEDGTEFGVKPMGTEAQREQYWTDFQAGKLTGKMLTVKFFEWTTSENPVPRFPVGVTVRDYE